VRRVRYNVAASLDGFIADRDGGYGWIPEDPTVDFAAIFGNVDTVLLGRRSYELTLKTGGFWSPDSRVYVFSRTLDPAAHPDVTVVAHDAAATVAALRAEPGTGDIWLFGGGNLFRSLLDDRQVDRLEISIVPILLGGGVPLLEPGGPAAPLALLDTRRYPSGIVTLTFAVSDASEP
jgi:dihydrofolate reductase